VFQRQAIGLNLLARDPRSQRALLPELETAPAACDQIKDQYDDGDHDEEVDESSADMESESKKPQDHKNYEDCPEHVFVLGDGRRESELFPCAHRQFDSVTSC
jgi:hypothetical protein